MSNSEDSTWRPTPVLSPGESQGRSSLGGCRPWGRSESDTTERLHFHLSLSCTGGGNGNPLQCSCLENPRDGGAWGAAVYGVAQGRTRLKRLSSSSSSTERKPLEYKTRHHPTTSSTPCRMPHLNNNQNQNTSPVFSRQDHHLSFAHQRKNKKGKQKGKEKQKSSAQISPCMKLTQTTGPNLGGQNQKGRKNSTLEAWEKETSNTVS